MVVMCLLLQRIALKPHRREYWLSHSDHWQKYSRWLSLRGMYYSLLGVVLMPWLTLARCNDVLVGTVELLELLMR